ncbi:MAG: rhodanese-like domain-containing protein [Planctomycetota bacterium]
MPDFDRIKRDIRERYPTVAQITVPELRAWLADPQRPAPLLIDVRSVAEYEVSHLVGAAQAETLPEIRRIVESDPGQRPVVFYYS